MAQCRHGGLMRVCVSFFQNLICPLVPSHRCRTREAPRRNVVSGQTCHVRCRRILRACGVLLAAFELLRSRCRDYRDAA